MEQQLRDCLPPEESNDFCPAGAPRRAVCMARKPSCEVCTLRPWCDFSKKLKKHKSLLCVLQSRDFLCLFFIFLLFIPFIDDA